MTLKTTILQRQWGPKARVCVYSVIVPQHVYCMQAWQILVMTQSELCHYSYDFTVSPNIWSTASLCLSFVFLSRIYICWNSLFLQPRLFQSLEELEELEEQEGLLANLIGKQLK